MQTEQVKALNQMLGDQIAFLRHLEKIGLHREGKEMSPEWYETQANIANKEKKVQVARTRLVDMLDRQQALWNKDHVPKQVKEMVQQRLSSVLAKLPGDLKLHLLGQEEEEEESAPSREEAQLLGQEDEEEKEEEEEEPQDRATGAAKADGGCVLQ